MGSVSIVRRFDSPKIKLKLKLALTLNLTDTEDLWTIEQTPENGRYFLICRCDAVMTSSSHYVYCRVIIAVSIGIKSRKNRLRHAGVIIKHKTQCTYNALTASTRSYCMVWYSRV